MSVQAIGRRSGWLTFAAIVMFAVGVARLVSGIDFLADGNSVSDLTGSLFGDQLWAWGIWDLAIAGLALFAGFSLLSGGGFGRVVGYIWSFAVLVQSILIISWAPWYAAAAMTLAGLVMYALLREDVADV